MTSLVQKNRLQIGWEPDVSCDFLTADAPGSGGQVSRMGGPSVSAKPQEGAPVAVITAPCSALQGAPSHCASPA